MESYNFYFARCLNALFAFWLFCFGMCMCLLGGVLLVCVCFCLTPSLRRCFTGLWVLLRVRRARSRRFEYLNERKGTAPGPRLPSIHVTRIGTLVIMFSRPCEKCRFHNPIINFMTKFFFFFEKRTCKALWDGD